MSPHTRSIATTTLACCRLAAAMFLPAPALAQFRDPGDDCSNPILVTLPADLPFQDLGQTTCGRGNLFAGSTICGGALYAGGEEILYRLVITQEVYVDFLIEPHGTPGVLVLLDTFCWPGFDCRAYRADATAAPRYLRGLRLLPGAYNLVIDVAPSIAGLGCVPHFDLTLSETRGACCVGEQCVGDLAPNTCWAQGGRWYNYDHCETFLCPEALQPAPATCATAFDLGGAPRGVRFFTAMNAAGGPPGSCNASSAAIMQNPAWLRFTATQDGPVEVALRYEYDGVTVLYEGNSCGALTEVACLNSSSNLSDADQYTLAATTGSTYWLQVGDFGVYPMGGETHLWLRGAGGPAIRRGDANCDGIVSFADISPFIAALKSIPNWQAAYPGCPPAHVDVNADGAVDFGDISPFIAVLKGGG